MSSLCLKYTDIPLIAPVEYQLKPSGWPAGPGALPSAHFCTITFYYFPSEHLPHRSSFSSSKTMSLLSATDVHTHSWSRYTWLAAHLLVTPIFQFSDEPSLTSCPTKLWFSVICTYITNFVSSEKISVFLIYTQSDQKHLYRLES